MGENSRNIDNNQRGCCPGKRQRRGDKKDLGKKMGAAIQRKLSPKSLSDGRAG